MNTIKDDHDKLIGISAIILVGLAYNDDKNLIIKGLDYLKKNIKSNLDAFGFPKSRNINSAIFFLCKEIIFDSIRNYDSIFSRSPSWISFKMIFT